MNWAALTAVAAIVCVAAALLTGMVLRQLRRRNILDHPNDRSSHTTPVPRGGGLALMAVLVVAWSAFALGSDRHGFGEAPAALVWILTAAAVLAVVSWLDDLRHVPVAVRLGWQIAAVAAIIALVPADGAYVSGALPPVLNRLAAAGLWLWFINAFNFMDGIDGMAGAETVSIGIGAAIVAAAASEAGIEDGMVFLGTSLAAAAAGFLVWNWHPARIFLGDVGSVPLGFVIGWLLLELAARGYAVAALILPLYYLADATITLGRRVLRGERPWQAHRSHFYQRAVQRGLGHASVVRRVLAANAVLVALAVMSASGWPAPALAGAALPSAALVVALLLWVLARGGSPSASPPLSEGAA